MHASEGILSDHLWCILSWDASTQISSVWGYKTIGCSKSLTSHISPISTECRLSTYCYIYWNRQYFMLKINYNAVVRTMCYSFIIASWHFNPASLCIAESWSYLLWELDAQPLTSINITTCPGLSIPLEILTLTVYRATEYLNFEMCRYWTSPAKN